MSTENLERISNGHGNTACTGGELEVPWTERWPIELDEQRFLELVKATERYNENAESWATAPAVQDSDSASTDGAAVYNPGSVVADPSELRTISSTRSRRLSVSDAVTDRYREMEKRVEEQDRTIAELKGIIENLQDIVYRQKLDKEAETLVL